MLKKTLHYLVKKGLENVIFGLENKHNMAKFTHLTPELRYAIELNSTSQVKLSQKELAERLGVSASTISRELKRNSKGRHKVYEAKTAQKMAELKCSRKPYKITGELARYIKNKLSIGWSPEQIVGRLRLDGESLGLAKVCVETIYQYIYRLQKGGDNLYIHLRRKRKRRRKRLKKDDLRGKIKDKVMIDQRPQEVEDKSRIGDWEGDTIIGLEHQSAILTLVERVTKFTLIVKLESKTAKEVEQKIVEVMKTSPLPIKTITFDNGTEFANHVNIAQKLDCQVYFAFPYHSWERGLNENTNGLIRQYIPKKTCFKNIENQQINDIQNTLNNRPRKLLGFLTPIETIKIAFQT